MVACSCFVGCCASSFGCLSCGGVVCAVLAVGGRGGLTEASVVF